MRNYRQKMSRYRLGKARYRELRDYCLCAGRDERMIIESAAADAADEVIGRYILQHVLLPTAAWLRCVRMGCPVMMIPFASIARGSFGSWISVCA